jgi:hypothetical protein
MSSAPVAPDRTSTLVIPSARLIATSVDSRSPTMATSCAGTSSRPSNSAAMCSPGLPSTVSARVWVQASSAASIAAQSGSPPSGVGQNGSGLVATITAPKWRTARKARSSLA